jgi:hypothetical protein
MINIKDHIEKVKPRENSGSTATNRFDFQKNWAICKILELHQKPDDYLLTLEYYDDVIVFDSSTDPKKISFYQVKTNIKPNWTINSLLARRKGKKGELNSHLGKLYDHIEKFGDVVESLNFITNNKIKGKLKNSSNCEDTIEFCCADLDKNDLDKIISELKKEHSLNTLKEFEKITFFKLGELSIEKHTELTKASLADFLDKNLSSVKYQIAPLYKSIFDEIRMKSNVEKTISNFEELKIKKSISRENFNSYLDELTKVEDFKHFRTSIESRLNSESVDFAKIKSFLKYSSEYEIKKMNYNDKNLKRIERTIEKYINENTIDLTKGLFNSMVNIFLNLQSSLIKNPTLNNEMIKTIILHKLYE